MNRDLKIVIFGLIMMMSFESSMTAPPKFLNNTLTKYRRGFADDFPWDTFCVDNNVPDNTFFAHPESCEYYLVCSNGQLGAGSCEGFHFNPAISECVEPGSFDCVLDLLPVWPPPSEYCPPPGSNQLVILPSRFCDAFYICVNGQPVEMQCRPGQHWNAERLYCDHPSRAGCQGENGNGPLLPDCPIGFVGSFPHPEDCNLFIHCNNGNRNIQRCQHLHHFDVISGRCMIMTQAECIDEYRGRRA
ncbi:hypothetical protein PVAND_003570 [Polypedilum vanderplanki]|uniref:Chitin-binding type-2 domain-containing protein n=1 Tax=Polypedilum vanderplanki TaxID=319348 RepID=A0A9J6BUG1_POLVA|nr:hypothetical protein PVAND_003570 [Polypedilum vanderplanki]